jgi:hypothetical protein
MASTDQHGSGQNLPALAGSQAGVDRFTGDAHVEALRTHLPEDANVRRRVFSALLRKMNNAAGGVS